MSSFANRTALVTGASHAFIRGTAQAHTKDFARVIVFDGLPAEAPDSVASEKRAVGCPTSRSGSAPDATVLSLDTNGRPLRDWED